MPNERTFHGACPGRRGGATRPAGYSLIEILIATTLTLILLGAIMSMFGQVGKAISSTRSALESNESLRAAIVTLGHDLEGVTAPMQPPCRAETSPGYFSIQAGAAGGGDLGGPCDILSFTTRSTNQPFVGRGGNGTIKSYVAEVIWYVKNDLRNGVEVPCLHRRQFLVTAANGTGGDISAHSGAPNTLADLADPANRSSTGGAAVDDVIMENVVEFDVKVFDPGQGIYIDSTYDTGCTAPSDKASDGLDDNGDGVADDVGEAVGAQPNLITTPLRGIQIKIRTYEPYSRSVSERTVVQDFATK
jgi:type II secretory pathway component PulJ